MRAAHRSLANPAPSPEMPDLVLATLNSRYAHAALGLRCPMANLCAP